MRKRMLLVSRWLARGTDHYWRSFLNNGKHLWWSPPCGSLNKHGLHRDHRGGEIGTRGCYNRGSHHRQRPWRRCIGWSATQGWNPQRHRTIDGEARNSPWLRKVHPRSILRLSGRWLFHLFQMSHQPRTLSFSRHYTKLSYDNNLFFKGLHPLPYNMQTFYNSILSTKGNIFKACTMTWPPLYIKRALEHNL